VFESVESINYRRNFILLLILFIITLSICFLVTSFFIKVVFNVYVSSLFLPAHVWPLARLDCAL
jgi:hypothetical protein